MPAQRPQKAERKDVRCGGKAARAYKENEMRVISGTARGTRLAALPGEEIHGPRWTVSRRACSAPSSSFGGRPCAGPVCGFGPLGIEALSRGAARCVFIDSSREACAVVRQNPGRPPACLKKASVAETAAEMYLAACRERFDLCAAGPAVPSGYRSRAAACCGGRDGPGRDGAGGNGARRVPARALRHADAEKNNYKYGTVALARYEADAEF